MTVIITLRYKQRKNVIKSRCKILPQSALGGNDVNKRSVKDALTRSCDHICLHSTCNHN